MNLINNCMNCGHCKNYCYYKLDIPNLLKIELKSYEKFYADHKNN
jgi:predicted aldo/keto reductase-like oxidoreductase